MATARRMITSALIIAMLSTSAVATEDAMVTPGTPRAAPVLTRLREAELVDQMNYESYLGSRENDVAMYYYSKRRHVVAAIRKLESGEPVSPEEIKDALDTSEAWRYGATF